MVKWILITMEWWLLTFFISAILSLFLPLVPEFSLLLIILMMSLALLFTAKFRLMAGSAIAIVWILLAGSQYKHTLSHNNIDLITLHKQAHLIQGEVRNIVHIKSGNSRFNFLISHWAGQPVTTPFLVRLSWKNAEKPLLQGQQWQLAVKLKPSHGLANIGGFNYQVWLRQQQIVATGYVRADKKPKAMLINIKRNVLLNEQVSWRQTLYLKLIIALGDEPLGGLILALGFGERGKLTTEHWQVLSATATQHLIAISGLHIGIVAIASLMFIRLLTRLLPLNLLLSKRWQLKLMQQNFSYLAVLCSCFMAWYYAYLAGFSIPTLRALVMLLLFWSLKVLHIKLNLIRWFLLAIVIIVLLWPLSLISASFWLSVSALVIIFSTFARFSIPKVPLEEVSNVLLEKVPENPVNKKWRKIKARACLWVKTLLIMQLALTMAMLPIAGTLSYQLPLAAFFANIIAVPLMSVSVIPLTLLAVVLSPFSSVLSGFVVDFAVLCLSFVWQWLSYLADAKWAMVTISYQQIKLLMMFFIFIALALFFRLSTGKFIATLGLFVITVSLVLFKNSQQQTWQLSVLDVGHGLAIVIEKNNHVYIYDTGASYPSGFNMADAALLPYLAHQGHQSIDGVIISHNDNDHAGSLEQLRAKMRIDHVIANDSKLNPDRSCLMGQRFSWQGLSFEMLAPIKPDGDKNDDSCVVVVSDGVHSVLLPGDISVKQERRLLNIKSIRKSLNSDLLIVPHHGSKSSSSRQFLTAVSPSYAVFSAGYLNRWHMPTDEITKRYNRFNIQTFNTAEVGMVTFKFSPDKAKKTNDEKHIEVLSYRENMRPYWFVN